MAAALDSVRPFWLHGGDVELLELDEAVGAVHLRLLGSCDGCPSSRRHPHGRIERAIAEAAPETTGVEVTTEEKTGTLLQIGARPPGPCPVPEG